MGVTASYLAEIDGMAATAQPHFDRERWTTCHIGSLAVGDVFALPREVPVRPAVLTATRTEGPADNTWLVAAARYIDNGEPVVEIKLRPNTPVPTRCDLYYAANAEVVSELPTEGAGQLAFDLREKVA